MTAPVSAGDVRTRIASGSAVIELLGAVDPIPVARHRLEAVVHRHVLRVRSTRAAAGPAPGRRVGEDVARQQQHRQAVDRRRRRAGDHVGRARADRRGAGERRAGGCASWRSRPRCAPSPARSAAGSSAAIASPVLQRLRRCRRRCRGRRCRSTPPKNGCSSPSRLECCCAGTRPAPAPSSGVWWVAWSSLRLDVGHPLEQVRAPV